MPPARHRVSRRSPFSSLVLREILISEHVRVFPWLVLTPLFSSPFDLFGRLPHALSFSSFPSLFASHTIAKAYHGANFQLVCRPFRQTRRLFPSLFKVRFLAARPVEAPPPRYFFFPVFSLYRSALARAALFPLICIFNFFRNRRSRAECFSFVTCAPPLRT